MFDPCGTCTLEDRRGYEYNVRRATSAMAAGCSPTRPRRAIGGAERSSLAQCTPPPPAATGRPRGGLQRGRCRRSDHYRTMSDTQCGLLARSCRAADATRRRRLRGGHHGVSGRRMQPTRLKSRCMLLRCLRDPACLGWCRSGAVGDGVIVRARCRDSAAGVSEHGCPLRAPVLLGGFVEGQVCDRLLRLIGSLLQTRHQGGQRVRRLARLRPHSLLHGPWAARPTSTGS